MEDVMNHGWVAASERECHWRVGPVRDPKGMLPDEPCREAGSLLARLEMG